jgi:hypothetical protein
MADGIINNGNQSIKPYSPATYFIPACRLPTMPLSVVKTGFYRSAAR